MGYSSSSGVSTAPIPLLEVSVWRMNSLVGDVQGDCSKFSSDHQVHFGILYQETISGLAPLSTSVRWAAMELNIGTKSV